LNNLKAKFLIVAGSTKPTYNGGIFTPNRMWLSIVDRTGQICLVTNTANDPWPGSRAIAIAKASTANDFSNNGLALSTANLYAATQPGGSLWGLNESNPFDPAFLAQGSLSQGAFAVASNSAIGPFSPKVPGGVITFGGGVALYQGGQVIGGLGVSGDSSCADHAIAYHTRYLAGLSGIPSGVNNGTDNILYLSTTTPPAPLSSSAYPFGYGFAQPHCFPSDVTPQNNDMP
jgi:uncharacterized protein GlcG (DUF336 family)